MMTSDNLALDCKSSPSNFNMQHPGYPPAPDSSRAPKTGDHVYHAFQQAPEASIGQLWQHGVCNSQSMCPISDERLAHARQYPYRTLKHECVLNSEKSKSIKMKQTPSPGNNSQGIPMTIGSNLPHREKPDGYYMGHSPKAAVHDLNHGVQPLPFLPPPPPHLSSKVNLFAAPPTSAQPPPPSCPPPHPPQSSLHPPPPAPLTSVPPAPVHRHEHVSTPAALIPVNYSGESVQETSRIVMIEQFRRNVVVSQHVPQATDLNEHMWLLKHGNTEVWYEKPQKAFFKQMKAMKDSYGLLDLPALDNSRPVSLETPKLWASRALTTPTDDDVYECTANHPADGGYVGSCHQCSEEKSEALDATSLEYCLIMTSCQASDPFVHGSHFNGKQIYKMVKCGSREAAISEAFYATGVNGWNIVFSCALRLGEGFDDRSGSIRKVDELWELADTETDEEADQIRIFY